jgi:hypothetical protein
MPQNKNQMRNSITPLGFGGPEKQNLEPELLKAAQHVSDLFKAHGWRAKLTPGLLAAAFRLNENPSAWLKAVPEVLLGTLRPHWDCIPYMITSLRLCNSMLCIAFAQEIEQSEPTRTTQWNQLRITLNYSLRPNLWTFLTSEERLAIWDQRP